MDVDEVTHLSHNALREILAPETTQEAKGKTYFVQAVDVKVFTEADNKKNIRMRIKISDGISQVVTMVTDRVEQQMVSP